MGSPRRLRVTRAALVAAVIALSACSATGSSSSEQQPAGQSPAVTVIVRIGGPDGSSVELVGLGTDPVELEQATASIAQLIVGPGSVGSVQPGVSAANASPANGQPSLVDTRAPIVVSDQAFQLTLSSEQIGQALSAIAPTSTDVWVCTDRSRTVQVTSQAPGAISTDVASGTCQSAGSSLERDGVTWSAAAAIGPVQPPSKRPWIVGILVALAVLVTILLSVRAKRRDGSEARPPPVH